MSAHRRPAAPLPMDLHSDSGQSTIEWLALMAMLVALAGVLVTTMPGLAHTIVARAAAYLIGMLAAPAGTSGAVLLFQVSVLGTPSPGVTPANLLCKVVATPGAARLDPERKGGSAGLS